MNFLFGKEVIMSKIATAGECYEIRNAPDDWWVNHNCPTKQNIMNTGYFNIINNSYDNNQLVQLADVVALPYCELGNNTSSNAKVGSADVTQTTISAKGSATVSVWKNKTLEWHILSSPTTAKSGENICVIVYNCPSVNSSDIVDVDSQNNFSISFKYGSNNYSKIYFTLKNNSYTSNPFVVGNYMIKLNRFKYNNCSFKIFMG